MREISLTTRLSGEEASSSAVEVALLEISHVTLAAPIRLSTDPTERLGTEPLAYGTRSAWRGADPETEPFLFLPIAAELPGDQDDVPAAATLRLANLSAEIGAALRSITSPAAVAIGVVMATSPDLAEVEFDGLLLVAASGDAGEIRLELSRRPIEDESVPMDRFTRDRFPGLFR